MLLIGRDLQEAHHVQEQIIGPSVGPFAQKLPLGWVLIGETCMQGKHAPRTVHANKTFVHNDGRCSMFQVCENKFDMVLNDNLSEKQGSDIFVRTRDDNKPGLSVEDKQFLNIMNIDCKKCESGYWVAPLPFRPGRPKLPNNRDIALKRAMYLDSNFRRNRTKAEHFMTFMAKVIDSGAAEVAPPVNKDAWYLPIFGVYHPKKPDKIRGVFDSSAMCQGISLNQVLLSGPNMVNSLLSILLRFRKDLCAVMADIEQMFYSFLVKEEHRDFLRFFWYQDNNIDKALIEYRMCAHVFGNSPSPAVATFALRKTVEDADADVKEFVNDDFYVDDGLVSLPEAENLTNLVKKTQNHLASANLKLHKIASNSTEVMRAFPEEDLQNSLKSLNLDKDMLPVSQSLGLSWNLESDSFEFITSIEERAFTRRGLLSTVNGIYDPLGFIAPLTIRGKILLRELTAGTDWDEPLNPEMRVKWQSWKHSLQSLERVSIPRMYIAESLSTAKNPELHIFSDASEKAISAVAYIRLCDKSGTRSVGFAMGKSKLAPVHGHTVPRLELCAALLASEIGQIVVDSLKVKFSTVKFYTDSRVVLGYINNTTRRFHNYVSNRVSKILYATEAKQWSYIHSEANPADVGSRGSSASEQLMKWLQGPGKLHNEEEENLVGYPMISPDEDKEVRNEVIVRKTTVSKSVAEKFEKFSSWTRLVRAFMVIKGAVKVLRTKGEGVSNCEKLNDVEVQKETERLLVKLEQSKSFSEEINALTASTAVRSTSSISSLKPYIDDDGILRVGGRLNQSCLPLELTNPVILSGKSHLSKLLVLHLHEKCKHQGRHLTEGTIRNHGYWIVGAKRLVSAILHQCVICRKLRGKTENQLMADLPTDRVTPGPPFTSVGVDVFGPWAVVSRKTRGGVAHSKRWAVLFTCMTTRAVHIEVIEEMSSSSFINALRRFISLRGEVKEFRSDRGTNFVGAMEDLKFNVINVEDGQMATYLRDSQVTWKFNAPHSSHMGGAWERMVGIARRIIDAMLLKEEAKNLTHEVLVTFMAEVVAIMNSRPIAPISTDADCPFILSPAMLLNQKTQTSSSIYFKLDSREMYKKQWKHVQLLSDMFWNQWRDGYLRTLQTRRKWQVPQPCIKNGDIVLLKEKGLPRNQWSVGLVLNAIKSDSDNLVRKAEIRVCKNGKCTTYTRPITEMVLLAE